MKWRENPGQYRVRTLRFRKELAPSAFICVYLRFHFFLNDPS
jgi:hypothetical protein